ncbi:MAG: hypothetical protein WCJ70_01120 [bacterium]
MEQVPQTPIQPLGSVVESVPLKKPLSKVVSVIVLLVAIVAGGAIGVSLRLMAPKYTSSGLTKGTVADAPSSAAEDKKTFKDTATGVLREGGIEGEGSHHLERGAKDQTAYLTSSSIDMTPYIGKKVKVWGATNKGQKAGWLMDVGSIEEVK